MNIRNYIYLFTLLPLLSTISASDLWRIVDASGNREAWNVLENEENHVFHPEQGIPCRSSDVMFISQQTFETLSADCEQSIYVRVTQDDEAKSDAIHFGTIPSDTELSSRDFRSFIEVGSGFQGLVTLNNQSLPSRSWHLAIHIRGSCSHVSIPANIVNEPNKCPEKISNLVHVSAFCTREKLNENIPAQCVAHASVTNGENPKASCGSQTSYKIHPSLNCACDPGYTPNDGSTKCIPCERNYFKSELGNGKCTPCPRNTHTNETFGFRQCDCDKGYFRQKGDHTQSGECSRPQKPPMFPLGGEYNWVEVSFESPTRSNPLQLQIIPATKQSNLKTLRRTLIEDSPVIIGGLSPNTEYKVALCRPNPELDIPPMYELESTCQVRDLQTSDAASIENFMMTINMVDGRISTSWSHSVTLDEKYGYKIEFTDTKDTLLKTELDHDVREESFQLASFNSRKYRAILTLKVKGKEISRVEQDASLPQMSTNRVQTINERMSTILVAVVGLILLILFIVFMLAVMWLKSRHDTVYSPHHIKTQLPYLPTEYSTLSPNMYAADCYSTLTRAPPTCQFMEPKALAQGNLSCLPDVLGELGVAAYDNSAIVVNNNAPYFTLLNGMMKVTEHDYCPNKDMKYRVDLKTSVPEDDPLLKFALLEEAAILKQLSHNHVVMLHGLVEFGHDSQSIGLLLESCGSRTLLQFCREQAGLQDILWALRGVSLGLDYFHQQGYVHKVLSASNVLVTDNSGVCRISGFEQRVHLDQRVRDDKVLNQMIPHFAPETLMTLSQIAHFDSTTDIWSLGVLIWQCFHPSASVCDGYGVYTSNEVRDRVLKGQRLRPTANDAMPPMMVKLMAACFENYRYHESLNSSLIKRFIDEIVFSKSENAKEGYCEIEMLLQKTNSSAYWKLFEQRGLFLLQDVDWTDAFLKDTVGIADKKDRRKLISSSSQMLKSFTSV